MHVHLLEALQALPRNNLTFLVTSHGAPFTAAGFGNWFRDRCNEAGLKQCSAHGLRKAIARRLAEAGNSASRIASVRALRRDDCGDWRINGNAGHIYADGSGWRLCVSCRSPRHWTATKRRLGFCTVATDGDDEGSLRLDRLPTPEEAKAIRDAVGVRKRKDMTEGALAALRKAREKSPLQRSTATLEPSRLSHPARAA